MSAMGEGSSANGSADPSKTASKGSAGPSKTAPSTDDASPSRVTPSKVRVEGVRVDIEGFVNPKRSTSSGRPQVPHKSKDKVTDMQKKVKKNLVLSNQYSVLSDDEMDSSSAL